MIASVIEERSGSRAEFVERVRDALYAEFPFYRAGVEGDDRKRFLDDVERDNKTLRAVAALCVRGDEGPRYSPNRQIRAVISLNLDRGSRVSTATGGHLCTTGRTTLFIKTAVSRQRPPLGSALSKQIADSR